MQPIASLIFAVLITGCAAKSLNPGAQDVFLSNDQPPSECRFVAEVVGGQGNWWTDDITSTRNLLEGSRNELRNSAHELGANFVHIQQSAHDTSYLGGGKIGITGNAYYCPSRT